MNHTLTLDTLFAAHGYYSLDTAEGRHYIETSGITEGAAYSYHIHTSGMVEFELLTICTHPRHEVCDISTPEGMITLIHELIDHKTKGVPTMATYLITHPTRPAAQIHTAGDSVSEALTEIPGLPGTFAPVNRHDHSDIWAEIVDAYQGAPGNGYTVTTA